MVCGNHFCVFSGSACAPILCTAPKYASTHSCAVQQSSSCHRARHDVPRQRAAILVLFSSYPASSRGSGTCLSLSAPPLAEVSREGRLVITPVPFSTRRTGPALRRRCPSTSTSAWIDQGGWLRTSHLPRPPGSAPAARIPCDDAIACSVNTLLKGLATLCIGGGQGVAMALESVD